MTELVNSYRFKKTAGNLNIVFTSNLIRTWKFSEVSDVAKIQYLNQALEQVKCKAERYGIHDDKI